MNKKQLLQVIEKIYLECVGKIKLKRLRNLIWLSLTLKAHP